MSEDTKDSRIHAWKVKDLSRHGIQPSDIAKYLDISKEQLINEYSDILNTAAIDATVEIAHKLYEMAIEGNVQSAIQWLKTIGRWDEIGKLKEEPSKEESFDSININVIPNKNAEKA